MDATVGRFRRRRSLFAALGALVLVAVALGGVLLVTSSGAETASKSNVRTPAGSTATEPSTTTTSAAPVVAPPAASPTGSTAATSSAPAAAPPEQVAPAGPTEFLLVCEGPVIVDPDTGVETSSSNTTRVAVGTPVGPGCHREEL